MPTPRKTTAKKSTRTPRKAAPRSTTAEPTPPTGIAQKRAQIRGEDGPHQDPYAPTVWGVGSVGTLVELTVPSGQMVLAQRTDPEALMVEGMLDDMDMLATILPKIMGGRSKRPAKDFDATEILKNPKMARQALRLIDRVLCHIVVKPEITPEPDDARKKERGKIYPSSIGMADKVFIFNWAVGGTRDLARFQQQYEESVAGVEPGEDVESETV